MEMSDMNHVQVVLTKKDNLKKALSGIDVSAIKRLTIKGDLNYESVEYIGNSMSETLVELDISEAVIINDKYYKYKGFLRISAEERKNLWIFLLQTWRFKKLEKIALGASITNHSVRYVDMPLQELPDEKSLFNIESLRHIEIHKDNPVYLSIDGVVFDKKGTLIRCPRCKEGDYDIPDTTIEIESGAFRFCRKLRTVRIPSSVKDICLGNYSNSFDGCTAFIEVDPENPRYKVDDNGKIVGNIDTAARVKIMESYVKELVNEILKDYDIELKSETVSVYNLIFRMRPRGGNLDVMGMLMERIQDEFFVEFSEEEIVGINTMDAIIKWLVNNLSEEDLFEIIDSYERKTVI